MGEYNIEHIKFQGDHQVSTHLIVSFDAVFTSLIV